MAERRMFSKSIVMSDEFLEMPATARSLYISLSMLADDDGFVNNARSVMRLCGARKSDMDILLSKKYILAFDNGLVVIKHWRINNYIQKDRYVETKYLEEKNSLYLDDNKAYTRNLKSAKFTVYGEELINSRAKNEIPVYTPVYNSDTQVSIGKYSINTTTTTNNKSLPYTDSDYMEFFKHICEVFKECGVKSNPEDFIAYNNSREWKGIGGESVLDDLHRYVMRWDNIERGKGLTKK